jgi:hypothetical protein
LDGVEEDGEFEELVVCTVGSGGQAFLQEGPGDTGMGQSIHVILDVRLDKNYNDA